MPRVTLETVTKSFQRNGGESIRALSGVSLVVEDRECLAVIGPSGSGKTTLLRLVAGLETPAAGKISIGAQTVSELPASQRDVAMIFQTPALYPHLSAYDNLGFGLKLRRCPRNELDLRVREIAGVLGLTACLDAMPMELSGGQRQRVAIGRALVRRPQVLLLDEPLANIDPSLRAEMRKDISTLPEKFGTTMIYVTHDHLEALMMGRRIAVLNEGVLQQIAEPVALYQRPGNLFVARFIGSPPMNFFQGVLLRQADALFFHLSGSIGRSGGFLKLDSARSASLDGFVRQPILMGVRPEHIQWLGLAPIQSSSGAVTATVSSVQPVGADAYISAIVDGNSFLARVPATVAIARGQECAFGLDPLTASFFDPVTGQSIGN